MYQNNKNLSSNAIFSNRTIFRQGRQGILREKAYWMKSYYKIVLKHIETKGNTCFHVILCIKVNKIIGGL